MSLETEAAQVHRLGLARLFWIFFRIGCISWGGYMALVSVVRSEVVERHHLLDEERLLEGVALAMLLPGPVAVNVVAYVGLQIRGGLGAAISVLAVVLPSFGFMLGFAYLYLQKGEVMAAQGVILAVLPAVSAVILNAARKMRGKALQSGGDALLALIAALCLLSFDGLAVVILVLCGGAVFGLLRRRGQDAQTANPAAQPSQISRRGGLGGFLLGGIFLLGCLAAFLSLPLLPPLALEAQLFATFSGMSLLLFGGGYVIIPMIEETVVQTLGWLSSTDFAASIALGQITPGPILISATFIGYKVAGFWGAVSATLAIFMPPALLITLVSGQLARLRHLQNFEAIQSGLRPVILGMIVAAGLGLILPQLLIPFTPEVFTILAIWFAALFALCLLNLTEVWVIAVAAAVGLLLL